MQKSTFNRRIFTYPAFISAMQDIIDHYDDLVLAHRSKRVDKTFAEKIMLVVSRVNGCRYCIYGHTRAALSAGVSETDLKKLMAGEIDEFPQEELAALTFAQHYADTQCQPDQEAWEGLVNYYGSDTARDILAYLRMITFGNLLGNTFDGFLYRFSGRSAPESSLLSEIGVLLGVVFLMPIYFLLNRVSHVFSQQESSKNPFSAR
jgi:AhpD family alkylhydroperoxidase